MNTEMKRKHHIIPRFYLEGFCDQNNMIWTYSKLEPTKAPYPQKSENVAIESYFYTLYGANINPNTFEDALAEIIENPAVDPLKQLRNCQTPSFEERQLLSLLFAFMLVRTPSYKNITEDLINNGLNKQLKYMAKNTQSFQKTWRVYCQHTGEPFPEDFASLQESILNEQFKIELTPNYSLLVIQKLGFEFSALFATMKWIIYKAPDNMNFITNDNPILVKSSQFNIFNPSFLLEPGSEIFIPISKNIGLSLIREGEESTDTEFIDDKEITTKMNNELSANAKKYVYAAENSETIKNLLLSN